MKIKSPNKRKFTPTPLPRSVKPEAPPAQGHSTGGASNRPQAFKPGNKFGAAGRPRGSFNAKTLFRNALEKLKRNNHIDLFEQFVKQAVYSPTLLAAAMNKLLPNKTEITFGDEEIQAVQQKFLAVVVKHVTDPKTLQAIADDLDKVVSEYEDLLAGSE